jgi:Holliday junction DNA helicase RuvA
MIGRLVGDLLERSPARLVVNAGGVGYEVMVSLQAYAALPAAGPVDLLIHTHVREAEITLYGFVNAWERILFRRLQKVSGIGPKLAMGILSQIPVASLVDAVEQRDLGRLTALPGVGKRTAERIVTELNGKLDDVNIDPVSGTVSDRTGTGAREDARLALLSLGYKESAVARVLERVLSPGESMPAVEEVLRRSLQQLAGG